MIFILFPEEIDQFLLKFSCRPSIDEFKALLRCQVWNIKTDEAKQNPDITLSP